MVEPIISMVVHLCYFQYVIDMQKTVNIHQLYITEVIGLFSPMTAGFPTHPIICGGLQQLKHLSPHLDILFFEQDCSFGAPLENIYCSVIICSTEGAAEQQAQ